jgi:inner membrane protein
METTNTQLNIFERLNRWIQESITVKLFSIGFLVLILLIPSTWITSLIEEREGRAEGVMQEVYQKWSGSQTLSGPILVIPYKKTETVDRGKEGKETREVIDRYYFLPEKLAITGEVNPKVLHRGIFDAAVYTTSLNMVSDFSKPDFNLLGIAVADVLWKESYMIFSISDLRGISDNPTFKVGEHVKESEPSNNLGVLIQETEQLQNNYYAQPADANLISTSKGIVVKLAWQSIEDFRSNTSVKLILKGSKNLSFVPTGKTTTVKLSGAWGNPSFDGEFLPEEREVTEAGFTASWKILHYNRPFSQQWKGDNQVIGGADFGVNLLIPVDQYQKSIRTSKYGQLVIILTFVALFLVEIIRKLRIHPFQYILIGVALIIYYTLLLSLSEQIGYNAAYGVASLATVGLISLYAASFLKNRKLILLFTSLLIVFYTFIFVIILQQDFSLLLGSIGLFLIVGALMYFSRKVEWYKGDIH